MYTIRSLSKELGVPYTTLRGYIMDLKRMKVIKAPEGPSGLMINETEKLIIEKIVRLVREKGYSLIAAVGEIQKDEENTEVLEKLDNLSLKIDEIFKKLERIESEIQECSRKSRKKWWMFWK